MCGIVGVYNKRKTDIQYIHNACTKMNKRGPDNSGVSMISKNVCFGHVRLSILDLSTDSNQPFNSLCGNYSITFNGEIYNFKEIRTMLQNDGCDFRTNGDTEVLLQLYIKKGISGLKYLRGMFAFCIYDKVKEILFLARDIAGEKPLFYCKTNDSFGFSSTISAIMELNIVPRIIDNDQVSNYLQDGYSQKNKSLIKDINKLEPGNFLIFDLKKASIRLERYWDIPKFNKNFYSESLENDLVSILEKSIEEQLFADVPTSILLSGGLDSSLVTALASNVKNKVQTFSVSFSKDKKYNEIEHANKIAKYYKTDHNVLNIDAISLNSLIEVCNNIDEPVIDSSFIPTFFLAKEVGKHTKVVLGGDGADELFGGYSHYRRLVFLKTIHKNFLFRKILTSSLSLIDNFESDSNKFKWLNISCQNLLAEVPKTAVYFRNPEKLFKNLRKKNSNIKISHSNRLLEASMEMDFNNFLSSDILVKVDRAMMSASVESRSPFLDKRVIDFAFSNIPLEKKISKNNGKIILQNIAKNLLPEDYNFGRKQGFNFNIDALMMKNNIINYMYEELDILKFCHKDTFEELVNKNKFYKGYGEKLFGLFILAFWIKKNKLEWMY